MALGDDQRDNAGHERDEREVRTDGKEHDGEDQAQRRSHRRHDHRSARADVAWLDVATETRVALELLFDLAQNALFIL